MFTTSEIFPICISLKMIADIKTKVFSLKFNSRKHHPLVHQQGKLDNHHSINYRPYHLRYCGLCCHNRAMPEEKTKHKM